eukprot:SAG22_NODE_1089_length_5599_cov_19.018179_7_plen_218_part_00
MHGAGHMHALHAAAGPRARPAGRPRRATAGRFRPFRNEGIYLCRPCAGRFWRFRRANHVIDEARDLHPGARGCPASRRAGRDPMSDALDAAAVGAELELAAALAEEEEEEQQQQQHDEEEEAAAAAEDSSWTCVFGCQCQTRMAHDKRVRRSKGVAKVRLQIQKMEEQHKAAIGERSARIKKAEEACARLRARNDLIKKDKTDLEDKIKKIARQGIY